MDFFNNPDRPCFHCQRIILNIEEFDVQLIIKGTCEHYSSTREVVKLFKYTWHCGFPVWGTFMHNFYYPCQLKKENVVLDIIKKSHTDFIKKHFIKKF